MFLGELRKPVHILKGAGKKKSEALARLGVECIGDLLRLLPRGYEDRRKIVPIAAAGVTQAVLSLVEVVDHQYFGRPPKQSLKIIVRDATATASLLCFNRNFLAGKFPPGSRLLLFCHLQQRFDEYQASAFELLPTPRELPLSGLADTGASLDPNLCDGQFGSLLPIYPLSAGLHQQLMRSLIRQCLEQFGRYISDESPRQLRRADNFPLPTARALEMIHQPQQLEDTEMGRKSLAAVELFHLQFSVAKRGELRKTERRNALQLSDHLLKRAQNTLSFQLTADQEQCIRELLEDIAKPYPMARLLQGDVGSGKTLTALLSALPLIEAGYQVAFMAPTELLAKQHAENAAALLESLEVRLALFTGSVKGEARKTLLKALEAGEIDMIFGTHSLFSAPVSFKALRYCIIDEQHKFGVMQRSGLLRKGKAPDLLLMTATPIPRTMALTAFGDLKVSTIKTMPPGRSPVITHLAREENQNKVYGAVRKELDRGGQAYFVYPLIEGSGKSGLKSAEEMYETLRKTVYPDKNLALLHSRIAEEEKEEAMHRFLHGEIDILVATSVVEVGVDAPGASCMVIEHAERFGLSALHQLRGRVGRGTRQSYCFLIYSRELTETGKARLKIMKEHSDGFIIAEEDLKIRGPGELTGMRQAGVLELRFADLYRDGEILEQSRAVALKTAREDPELLNAENASLRKLYSIAPPFEDLELKAIEG